MVRKINQYLLTHYPLLWNTRIVWVMAINLLIHLLFFVSGFGSVSVDKFKDYNDVWEVGGGKLFTFSILCSLLVIIVWLIFYLRNNAFKSFYRLSRWYLVKEFLIILLVMFTSITYYSSFHYGVRTKARSITGQAAYIEEVNTINSALAYIPLSNDTYFVLNSCEEKKTRANNPLAQEFISSNTPYDSLVARSLKRPDAFSYRHYCNLFQESYGRSGIITEEEVSRINNRWILTGKRDSIRLLLQSFFRICEKYSIPYELSIDSLTGFVFADPYHGISTIIPNDEYYHDRYSMRVRNTRFLETYPLKTALSFIEECLPDDGSFVIDTEAFLVVGYTALSLSILLLAYRRFSRKVFLISIVGTIVWAILIGLMSAGSGSSDTFSVLCILLCLVFLVIGISVGSYSAKTTSGIMLNWHFYLAPYLLLFVLMLINSSYDRKASLYSGPDWQERFAAAYPFGHWVSENMEMLIFLNLLFAVLYTAFLMNRFGKKWQEMPEE
ncbi:MAG TPA: hypothetical protein VFR58_18160 [Flavisolibacter sp.]|nr:hypothetical protein [Flavisolibacter sp.]